jgi:hypothetical protein
MPIEQIRLELNVTVSGTKRWTDVEVLQLVSAALMNASDHAAEHGRLFKVDSVLIVSPRKR